MCDSSFSNIKGFRLNQEVKSVDYIVCCCSKIVVDLMIRRRSNKLSHDWDQWKYEAGPHGLSCWMGDSVNAEHLFIIDGSPPAKPHMGSWEQRASS